MSPSVARDIVKCMYLFEFARTLSASDAGLEALRYEQFSEISILYLKFALERQRQVYRDGAPAGPTGVSLACWLIAQGLFTITHSPAVSTTGLAPETSSLRDLLHETGGYTWLLTQNVTLPAWTD